MGPMKSLTLLAGSLSLLTGLGCTHPHTTGSRVDLFLGPECRAEVTLKDCELDDPPKCRTDAIKYKSGCEQIMVKK
jgi:hypothetical protein